MTYGPIAGGAGAFRIGRMVKVLDHRGSSLSTARRVVSWMTLVAGGVVVVTSLVTGFIADPQQGEGWIGGPIEAVFAGGPLIAVGFGLRSPRRVVARRTAIASLALALLVGFVLMMQLLDPNETGSDRMLNSLGLIMYIAAFAVELPAFTRRWATRDTSAGP